MASEPVTAQEEVPDAFHVLDFEPGRFLFAAYHNVTMFVWAEPPDGRAVQRLAKATQAIHDQCQSGLSNVHISRTQVGLPTADARDGLRDLMASRSDRRACLGVIVTGGGFWSSAIRSFITGLRVVTPNRADLGIHTSTTESAAWLVGPHERRTGVKLSAASLQRAMDEAYDRCGDPSGVVAAR